MSDAVLDPAYRLGFEPHLDERFEQMSMGTRREVFVTAAVLGAPAVVIAVGARNGFDAQGRAALAENVQDLGERPRGAVCQP